MIIETTNLCKRYGEKFAVKDLSISVPEGQIFGLLGPNGAGKSTLIKMLTGLVHPTGGEGKVFGLPLGNALARSRLGYLPELFRFQDWMSGTDLLNFHSELFKLKKDPERNRQVLSRVGLLGQENGRVGTYSKGMQQRIGLAAALLPDPELLLLDEPTSALDPIGRKEVRDIILSLKNEGRTVLLNSHLLSEVEAVSDSIAVINKGTLLRAGGMEELLSDHLRLTVMAENISEELFTVLERKYGKCEAPKEGSGIFYEKMERETVPEIVELLSANGARIYEVKTQANSLEGFFLEAVAEAGGAAK